VVDGRGDRGGALRAGPVATAEASGRPDPDPATATAEPRLPGDLIVRTTPDIRLRHGMQVPLLVDLAHLFVFDQHGRRICPSPDRLPDLEE
ncbi:sugar ABC transporter ATP-binding protein, partial [Streptomyces pilosus]